MEEAKLDKYISKVISAEICEPKSYKEAILNFDKYKKLKNKKRLNNYKGEDV